MSSTLRPTKLFAPNPKPEPTGKPDASDARTFSCIDHMFESSDLADWARGFLQNLEATYGREALERNFCTSKDAQSSIPRYLRSGAQVSDWLLQFFEYTDNASSQRAWLENGFLADDPAWLTSLLEQDEAQIARLFLLSGNISDYVYDPIVGYRPGIRLLVDTLRHEKDCVLTLSLSRGLLLHASDHHEDIKRRLKDHQIELGRFKPEQSLITQICTFFDRLRTWLEDVTEENSLKGGVAIVFENIHLLIPPEGSHIERNFLIDSLLSWSISPSLFHSPHCLILMAEFLEDVSNELRARGGKISKITISRPSEPKMRFKFLLALLQSQAKMKETRVARLTHGLELHAYAGETYEDRLNKVAHDTAGLTLMGIEDIVQQAAFARRALNPEMMMAAKRERLQQESDGLLEVIQPRRTLADLAGYQALKDRIQEIINAMTHPTDQLVQSTMPMGILFLGPPGTGKTIAAEAIAGASGINMAKLGDFRGMYVGQSERNLSRLLSLIESLHPVIIFMDELDQSEGTRSEGGDSGVSKRAFGKLLQFMSDTTHRGKIVWIGASNRPDLIDTAMKRAGRFDLILPFLLPDRDSRAAIFETLLTSKLNRINGLNHTLTQQDYQELAERTSGFSGAEIEGLIGEVLRRVAKVPIQDGMLSPIQRQLFDTVLDVYVPPQARQHYEAMELYTLLEVRFIDLLPPEYQEKCRLIQDGGIDALRAKYSALGR